jgi:putative phosphoribosyl transferase
MVIFADRAAAGRELARVVGANRYPDAVVFGIPRGGVVVAAEVARALESPLAAVVVRKLGAPSNTEFAIGAIASGITVVNPDAVRHAAVTAEQLAFIEDLERVELNRRVAVFASDEIDVRGRTAIVVDDGVATGATATAACQELKHREAGRVVLAVPVAPADWRPPRDAVDEYVCAHAERGFWAVGQYYGDFTQTTDAEVVELLSHNPRAGQE